MAENTLDAVIDYLKARLPDVVVDGNRVTSGEMSLLVSEEFVETVGAEEVESVLDWLDVIGQLRRAQGLPMVLTEHGVRLVSSN